MKIIAFFFFACFTILPEFYFVVPELTFTNFSLLLILYLFFVLKDELMDQIYLTSSGQKNEQIEILKISFIFLFYIFSINLYHGQIVYAIKSILLQSGTILCLPLFNYFYHKKKYHFIKWAYFFITVHFVFVLFQIFGINTILTDLMPQNMLIGTLEKPEHLSKIFRARATGAISSPIALATQILAFLVIAITSFNKNKDLRDFFFIFISIVILIATQARAAIFSIIPLLIMCNFIFKGWDIKKFIYSGIFIAAIIFIIVGFQESLRFYVPYTFKTIDLGDTHRFWTNIYISIGVLNESPFFGIPAEKAWDIFDKYSAQDYTSYLYLRTDPAYLPTHHNQLFFFLRYYGLIGVALLLMLYFKIFKAIKLTKDKNISFLVGTIFVLDLFFSMTHNNKIFNPILWIYLSLIFVPLKKEE